MKKILFFFIMLSSITSMAQTLKCITHENKPPIIFSKKTNDSLKQTNAINMPYTVKIYVTIFADNGGSNKATTNEHVLRQIQNMANQYQSQNICFLLVGIRQINNTDLNDHNVSDSTENTELTPYMVNGFLNIFVHKYLPGYHGYAYAIPNTYLSVTGNIIESTDVTGILGHEMGHCLGLYHTFSSWVEKNGTVHKENVARSGDCKNCEIEGDVLCDTPADDNGGVDASCIYTGTAKDACNTSYSPLTNNLMAYGDYRCITTLTNGQGERMRTFLATNSALNAFLVHDALYTPVFGNTTISSGTGHTLAREAVYISEGSANLTVNGTARQYYQAKKVSVKSGTKFSPASGGLVSVKSNPYCN
ncbi:M43 family zinc metalloprotease [Emticicia agri]|nr:M43 family zinc metalloprotease [Emticicia agri]